MKAVVYRKYGPPAVLDITELNTPVPKDNELLIKVQAAAVTKVDSEARQGVPFVARLAFGLFKPRVHVLGTEFAGEIKAVGKDVTRFGAGDHVYAAAGMEFGAHAEFICLPQYGALALKPVNASFEESASLCEGMLTALPFLRDAARLQHGQSILINGASGSVGTAAVQLADYFGAEVTGVCSTRNLELVKSLGADRVIDYTEEDFTKTGQTYDVILDAIGNSSFARCKGSLKRGGVYLTTVLTPVILPLMLWTSWFGGKKAKIAFTGLRPPGKRAKDLDYIRELAEAGKIKSVIDRTYPLDQATAAHAYVDQGHKRGSVVLTI